MAEICRHAGLANGTFYRYFENKAAAFVALTSGMASELAGRVRALGRRSPGSREFVDAYVETFVSFVRERRRLFQVFRQSEFVDRKLALHFYDTLTEAVLDTLELESPRALHDPSALAVADMVIGAPILWAVHEGWRNSLQAERAAIATIAEFITDGLGGRPVAEAELVERVAASWSEPAPGRGRSTLLAGRGDQAPTRERLLRAAERVLGRKGFHGTGVVDVTRAAHVGVGTFYMHFRSKRKMLEDVVETINERLREHLSTHSVKAAGPGADRRLIEGMGLVAFIAFVDRYQDVYRVVREAEFVDESLGRSYYERLAQPYARALERAMQQGQIRPGEPSALAYALMGVGHFVGLRWILWKENRPPITKSIVTQLTRLILRGVAGVVGEVRQRGRGTGG